MKAIIEIFPANEGQPPVGALIPSEGERVPFTGWIELASAIEDWRHVRERRSNTEPTGGR